MAQKRKQSPAKRPAKSRAAQKPHGRLVAGLLCILFALLTFLYCFDVHAVLIDAIAHLCLGLIGIGFYSVPFALLLASYALIFHRGRPVRLRVTCAALLPVTIGAFLHMLITVSPTATPRFSEIVRSLWAEGLESECGGVVAGLIGMGAQATITAYVAVPVLIVLSLLCILKSLDISVSALIKLFSERPKPEYKPEDYPQSDPIREVAGQIAQRKAEPRPRPKPAIRDIDIPVDDPIFPPAGDPKKDSASAKSAGKTAPSATKSNPAVKSADAVSAVLLEEEQSIPQQEEKPKMSRVELEEQTAAVAKEIDANTQSETDAYQFPSLDILSEGSAATGDGSEEMRVNSERLDDALQSFGIDAHIINVIRGPAVTRYELELDRGVKLSRVTALADDLALALGASGVRIAAIPDKISIVGIEVPNKSVASVCLRDVLSADAFVQSKSTISFAVGKDIGGNAIVGNIAKLPHLLIAGTTGSGKSVCINSLIVSLLYKANPEQVRMIMIDPKMVELGIYNSIPHLLVPVVTDPKKAAGSLQWAVFEMLRRYRMMADAGVRDLESYNQIASKNDELDVMPQIVVIIDELADLMMAAAKEVEDSICRVAQMGRAAGMHLVIATQRPSADVITGLMKANIPSRIAFAVASAMESRIILDTQGAEKLVGKGDMLYAPLGQGKPKRVQGCFVSDEEVQRVVNAVGKNAAANYDREVEAQIERNVQQGGKNAPTSAADAAEPAQTECDELLEPAVDIILETGQASVSMLQRRLKLGYARAARIVDEMEERGIVGPFSGSKPRELLITKEEWDARKTAGENPPVEEEI